MLMLFGKIKKKTIYLLMLLVITLFGFAITGTYAMFTKSYTSTNDVVGLNLAFQLNISNIEEYDEINVDANAYQIFNVQVQNNTGATAYYGIWYKMVNPSEINDNIVIARLSGTTVSTSGSVANGSHILATIIVQNNTNTPIKINVGVASSSTSVSSIEYLDGKTLISGTAVDADYYYDESSQKYISTTDSTISFTTNSQVYSYTGASQTFTSSHDGAYKLEAWGAQGASDSTTYVGGYGAYAVGSASFKKNSNAYVFVGGKGQNINNSTTGTVFAYPNGGAVTIFATDTNNITMSSGGASSHITLSNSDLSKVAKSSILLVAAGGGGSASWWGKGDNGGSGGGIVGSTTTINFNDVNPTGGTQTAGGNGGGNLGGNSASSWLNGVFGIGGGSKVTSNAVVSGGGGGGYYGGGASWGGSGAGGSSYIGNSLLKHKAMYCYQCQTSSDEATLTYSNTYIESDSVPMFSKKGDGKVYISPVAPTVSLIPSIGLGVQLEKNQVTCHDNGSGCRVIFVSNTSLLASGTQSIRVVVVDDFGYTYRYTKSIVIGSPSLLSNVLPGSYVKYAGTNGCTGSSCTGQNANYVDDSNMGYCDNSGFQFKTDGWRVAYVSDGTAYLVSGGAPECLSTDANGNASSSNASSYDSSTGMTKHLANLNSAALKYCNSSYAYGGVCNTDSAWDIKASDFQKITGNTLSMSSCYNSLGDMSCGYLNDLIDNGGFYYYATLAEGTWMFRWAPTYFLVNAMHSHSAGGVRPILRMKATVAVTGGSGTKDDPYTISPS